MTMYTQTVAVPLTDGPDGEGVISGTTDHTFPDTVIEAIGALNSYKVSFPGHNEILTVGASCEVMTQRDSPTVTVKGSVQIYDTSNKADKSNSSLDVAVIAWCL